MEVLLPPGGQYGSVIDTPLLPYVSKYICRRPLSRLEVKLTGVWRTQFH